MLLLLSELLTAELGKIVIHLGSSVPNLYAQAHLNFGYSTDWTTKIVTGMGNEARKSFHSLVSFLSALFW